MKKSAYDQLLEDNRELVKSVNKLTDSLTESNKRVGELTAALAQAQDNLAREQAIHGDLRLEYNELKKRLVAGSAVEQAIPAEDPEQKTEDSSADPEQASPQNEDKPDPEGESQEEKKPDPEKTEGETASAESSSPVTIEEKPKQKRKATLKQRLRFLFHGEIQS